MLIRSLKGIRSWGLYEWPYKRPKASEPSFQDWSAEIMVRKFWLAATDSNLAMGVEAGDGMYGDAYIMMGEDALASWGQCFDMQTV